MDRTTTIGDWGLPRLQLRSASTTAAIRRVRHSITEWTTLLGLPAAQVYDIAIASYEAMANTVAHAYLNHNPDDTYIDNDSGTEADAAVLDIVATTHRDDDGFFVVVNVTDYGSWRDPESTPSRPRFGCLLMYGLTDQCSIASSASGTTVELTWRAPDRP
jgi:serine/threonine-protein kinase RsbW